MQRRPRTRRAAMYLAVLMTAMIVAVIGVSAITAARIQLQAAKGGVDLAQARCCAQSAVEFGLLEINGDTNWRTTYSHDTWSADQDLRGGVFAWKLVDEVNGDLTSDPEAPTRIYGMGVYGETARVFSVLFASGNVAKPNFLKNPGMESGVDDWSGAYGCSVVSVTTLHHDGGYALKATDRSQWYMGARQDVTSVLEDETTYEIEAWMRPGSFSVDATFFMYIASTGSGTIFPQVTAGQINPGSWTHVTAELTPNWSGTLTQAYLIVTTSHSSADFYLDDVIMRESGLDAEIVLFPGSWRREVDETAAISAQKGLGQAPELPAQAGGQAMEAMGQMGGGGK